jgi:hypothetical protein
MLKDFSLFKTLVFYYGTLQSLHLVILIRAGLLILSTSISPFPILPPPNGWQDQVWPFMFALAGMDVLGILLAIIFAYYVFFKGKVLTLIGILSLTIFISGAIVFAAGTICAGAWQSHPLTYGVMAILFLPSPILLGLLIHRSSKLRHIEHNE